MIGTGTWSALGVAAFVLAQAHAATLPWSLPLLAATALAAAPGLDGHAAPDRSECALLLLAASWLASCLLGLGLQHSLALSMPLLALLLLAVLLRRSPDPRVRIVLVLALLALATWQCLSVLVAGAGTPQQRVNAAATPWLLVPNDIAWMACCWPWFLRWSQRPLLRLGSGLLVGLQAAVMVSLGSRLALLAGALALLVAQRRRLRWRAALALAAVSAAALALLLATGAMPSLDKGFASLHARLQLWQAALDVWWQSPWFGVGPGHFGTAYPGHVDPAALSDPRFTPWPHSLPLQWLAEAGVVGVAALSLLLHWSWRAARDFARARAPGDTATAGVFVAFVLVGLLEASSLRIWWWILAAALLATAVPIGRKGNLADA